MKIPNPKLKIRFEFEIYIYNFHKKGFKAKTLNPF